MPSHRYPRKAYEMLFTVDNVGRHTWASSVKQVLFSYRFGYVCVFQGVGSVEVFLSEFYECVRDILTQKCKASLLCSSRYDSYTSFKLDLQRELYLNRIVTVPYIVAT